MIKTWFIMYNVERVIHENETELVWYEEGYETPRTFIRIPELEQQIGYEAYAYRQEGKDMLDVLFQKGEEVIYLDLFISSDHRTEKEKLVIRTFRISNGFMYYYKKSDFEPIKDLVYTYLLSQPAWRLKEVPGMIQR